MTAPASAQTQFERFLLPVREQVEDEPYFTPREIVWTQLEGAREYSDPQLIPELQQQIGRLNRLRSDITHAGPDGYITIIELKDYRNPRAPRELANEQSHKVLNLHADRGCLVNHDVVGRGVDVPVPCSVAAGAICGHPALCLGARPITSPNSVPRFRFIERGQLRQNAFAALLRFLDSELARLRFLFMLALAAMPRATRVVAFILLLIAVCLRYGHRHEPSDDDEQLLARMSEITRRRV